MNPPGTRTAVGEVVGEDAGRGTRGGRAGYFEDLLSFSRVPYFARRETLSLWVNRKLPQISTNPRSSGGWWAVTPCDHRPSPRTTVISSGVLGGGVDVGKSVWSSETTMAPVGSPVREPLSKVAEKSVQAAVVVSPVKSG